MIVALTDDLEGEVRLRAVHVEASEVVERTSRSTIATMTTLAKRTGKCLYGAVKFSVDEANANHGACHCETCPWLGGPPFFGSKCKSVTFEDTEHLSRYESSPWAERGFCNKCGTILFF